MPDSKQLMTQEDYAKNRGLLCPVCGANHAIADALDITERSCMNCGAEWTDQTVIVGYTHLAVGKRMAVGKHMTGTICQKCGKPFGEHDEEGKCPEEANHA